MGVLDKIGGFLGGGLGEKIADIIGNNKENKAEAEKMRLEIEAAIGERAHAIEMAHLESMNEAERLFNERTIQMEGTASDLTAVPYVGAVLIMLRGAFRPLFAYLVAYFDWLYFKAGFAFDERQSALLMAINLLVLIFFFGERAMKNVMPIIVQMFAAKSVKE